MGIFDFLKKKKNITATSYSLEELLQKAATEPTFRIEFAKRLPAEQLVVLTDGKEQSKDGVLVVSSSINIRSLSDGKVPVFTSNERIFDKQVIKEQVNFIKMKGEDLFTLTKGATLILNPFSDYGKHLLPDEIERMLNGTEYQPGPKKIVIEKDTKVLIGQPAIYPAKMIEALIPILTKEMAVISAYIGMIQYPDSNDPPHYIIGINALGDIRTVTEKVGRTAELYLNGNEVIDLVKIDHNSSFEYFKTAEPFYRRT